MAPRESPAPSTPTRARTSVPDAIGHGTFVGGLIAAIDGNAIGTKGVAGNTRVMAVRASRDGFFEASDLIRGIAFAIRNRADVLNMSLAGRGISLSQARALGAAFYNDVLPVAASGNRGQLGNPLEFPAAALGGLRGRTGIGLSVAATNPSGGVAPFSNHNRYVSLAAPGDGPSGDEFGVFSTLPADLGTFWDALPLAHLRRGRGALRLRRGHELRGAHRGGHCRAHLAGGAQAGLGPGGRRARSLGSPDHRARLERVHRGRNRRRCGGRRPGARL